MDNILTGGRDLETLERRLQRLFLICRKKNIKLNPSKFELGRKVTFGGCEVQFNAQNNHITIDPDRKKIEMLEDLAFPKTRREAQSIVGIVNQLSK